MSPQQPEKTEVPVHPLAVSVRGSVPARAPRSELNPRSVIRTGGLAIDLTAKIVTAGARPVRLTAKEYAIFELLSLHKGTTMTKEMLLNHLYPGKKEPELKIIDVFICNLRRKLAAAAHGKHCIETVWGRGYLLRDPLPT